MAMGLNVSTLHRSLYADCMKKKQIMGTRYICRNCGYIIVIVADCAVTSSIFLGKKTGVQFLHATLHRVVTSSFYCFDF